MKRISTYDKPKRGYYEGLYDFFMTLNNFDQGEIRRAIRRDAFRDYLLWGDFKILYELFHYCLERGLHKYCNKIIAGVEEYNKDFNTHYNLYE